MAYFGPLPTFKVGSNSQINAIAGGLIDNVTSKAVDVALNPSLAEQILKSPNLLGSLFTPGLITTASQSINQLIAGSLENSKALGPFGPLASSVAQGLINNLTGDLIGSLNPAAKGEATRYFPGAGQDGEEDANYGGHVYTPGAVGPDVVFSIKPAQSTANAEAVNQVNGAGAGVPATQAVGEVNANGSVPTAAPTSAQTGLFQGVVGNKSDSSLAGFSLPGGGIVPPSFVPMSSSYGSSLAGMGSSLSTTSFLNNNNFSASTGVVAGNGSSIVGIPSNSSSGVPTVNLSSPTPVLQPGVPLAGVATPLETLSFTPGTQSYFSYASLPADALSNLAFPESLSILDSYSKAAAAEAAAEGWKFTTAPADITWDSAAKVDRVPIFGTNQPPVTSGSRGMRDLSLSNALIEGFSMVKSVEGKIAKLESLLNYTLTTSYVKVPVYWVTANDKKYGDGNGDGGYFVIKQIKVKEELRDLSGKSTRAMVDVSFTQVPAYQVDDGRDQASQSIAGGKSILGAVAETQEKTIKDAAAKGLLSVGDGSSQGGGGGTGSTSSKNSEVPFVKLGGVKVRAYETAVNENGITEIRQAQLVKQPDGSQVIQYLPRVPTRQ